MLHQHAAQLHGEHVIGGRGDGAESDENAVAVGQVAGFREEGGGVSEDGDGVRDLAFGKERDIDFHGCIAMVGAQTPDHGVAEGLDGGRGAGEPGGGDTEDLGITAIGRGGQAEALQRWERRGWMRLADDLEDGG